MSHFEHRGDQANHAVTCALREVIARKQVTLAALSTTTGIPRSTLTRKLRGRGDLTVIDLVRLAIALDVPAADLLEVAVEAAREDNPGTRT